MIFLKESLRDGTRGLLVADIDDTLIRADQRDIGIYKYVGGEETKLSTDEFARDPDRGKPGVEYDYREFKDPEKVRRSILNGTPIVKNLRIVDEKLAEGYDFAFLTARSTEDVIKDVLRNFLKVRGDDGSLKPIGEAFKEGLSHAVGDEKYCEVLGGMSDSERKGYFLEKVCGMYDHVIFLDDDDRNVRVARDLGLENLTVIKV